MDLPPKLKRPVEWLIATIEGKCGPGKKFEVPMRHLVLKGGRGSGKSHSVARILVNIIGNYGVRALCTRETQKSIEESVYQTLCDIITDLDFDEYFDKQKTTIYGPNGSQFIFAGLRTQDINKLKSTERIQLAWVEEAHAVSEKSLEVLGPTIREENSVIIYTYNPELEDDPVHARYALDPQPDVCVVELNWRDNPWFPEVLQGERERTFRLDKSPDKTRYNWIWEGKTLPAVEGAIFANEVGTFQGESRFRPIDHDTSGMVHGVMDLGWGVMTLALWQRFASTMQCIAYYEETNMTYADLTDMVKKAHPKFRWGKIFMPHDASHKDPKTGKSHKRVMEDLGWDVGDIDQIGVENYISMGRNLFETAYINSDMGGKRFMQCLKRFRRMVPETTGHPGAPMKDEFSHGGETWCYSAVVAEQMVNSVNIPKDPYKGFESGYAG